MGFVRILWKNNNQKAYLPKTSIVGQIDSEILAQLGSDDSIQILQNLTSVSTFRPKSNLERFVFSHQSLTGLISQGQFAPEC